MGALEDRAGRLLPGLALALVACGSAGAAPDKKPKPPPAKPATAAPKPAPAAPKPTGSLRLLAARPAMDMKELPGRLALVEPGFLSVTALDAATGKQAWTQKLQPEPARGYHILLPNSGQLIAWFGNRAHVVDAKTGARASDYDTVQSGDKCWLDVVDGVCAKRCDCSFQLASCATGAALGAGFEHEWIEEIDPDGGMSSGCWGEGGVLYGRAGAVALYSENDKQGRFVAAIDPATGREQWRRPYGASWSAMGHTPDAKTCWFSTSSDGIFGVDCATGAELWHDTTKWSSRRSALPAGAGVALLDTTSVALLDPRTGKRRWTRTFPATTLAWPAGSELSWLQETKGVTSLEILDLATGATIATLPFPAGAGLKLDAAGFFVSSPSALVAYDPRGKELARATNAPGTVYPGATLVAAADDKGVVVLDRATLAEVGRIPAKVDAVAVEGPLGAGRVATYTVNGFSVGAVGLYAR